MPGTSISERARVSSLGRNALGFSACLLVVVASSAACHPQSDPTGQDTGELQLEQQPIPTALKELKAGQGYLPGIDEGSMLVSNPCLKDPKILVRGGNVTSSAAIVQSRASLNVELGLEANALVPVVAGLTGTASLSAKTTFDSRSAVVLFQTTGTYESNVIVSDAAKDFDVANIAKCGYGFVARAQHRVAAALVVNMRSTNANVEAHANVGAGKKDILDAKGSISAIIQKGNIEVTLRFAADVIPDVPPPPFGDSAILTVGDGDAEKQTAIGKIESALAWLANANTAVQRYLLALQSGGDNGPPPAPTQTVSFRYYPSTSGDVRAAVEQTARNAQAIKKSLAQTESMIASWETFTSAAKDGHGHEWNVAAEPADSVDALRARSTDLLETSGGKLHDYENALSVALEACSLALRNDKASTKPEDVVNALKDGCKPPAAPPFDLAKNSVRPIGILSAADTDSANRKCAPGGRLPLQKEAAIFKAWSVARKKDGGGGLWTEDGPSCGIFSGGPWLNDGKLECAGVFGSKGLSVCVSSDVGPFPEE